MSFKRETPNRNVRKIAMRIRPSAALKAMRPCRTGYHFSSAVTVYSGINLYRKIKNPREKIRFKLIAQLETSLLGLLGFLGSLDSASRMAFAENFNAFSPKDMA